MDLEDHQQHADYNIESSSYNGYYDNSHTSNRRDEISNYYSNDPLYGRASEPNTGFAHFPATDNQQNSVSLSTSKGFDQELNILKDVDPLERLHAIARGEDPIEQKTSNKYKSRYEENSLSDKPKREKRKNIYNPTKASKNQSSKESEFTSFGMRKKSRKPSWAFPQDTRKVTKHREKKQGTFASFKVNPHKRRRKTQSTSEALSKYVKSKHGNQNNNKYEDKQAEYYDYQSDHYDKVPHNDYDHDHEEGNNYLNLVLQ